MFAKFEMTKMISYGMPGVWTHAFVDMWSPGYLGFMSSNHNGMLRMYETFGNGGANTMKRNAAGRRRDARRQRLRPERREAPARARRHGGSDAAGGPADVAADDCTRVVSSAASATHADLEHAQQHELHGDGGACRLSK